MSKKLPCVVGAEGDCDAYAWAKRHGHWDCPSRRGDGRRILATMASSTVPAGAGYWLVASDGGVFAFGDAGVLRVDGRRAAEPADRGDGGDAVGRRLLVGGVGRWHLRLRRRRVLRVDGRDAARPSRSWGWRPRRRAGATGWWPPTVGSSPSATPGSSGRRAGYGARAHRRHGRHADGAGYWLVTSDGAVQSFGDAEPFGSAGPMTPGVSVTGMAPTPSGAGYWLLASNGVCSASATPGSSVRRWASPSPAAWRPWRRRRRATAIGR